MPFFIGLIPLILSFLNSGVPWLAVNFCHPSTEHARLFSFKTECHNILKLVFRVYHKGGLKIRGMKFCILGRSDNILPVYVACTKMLISCANPAADLHLILYSNMQ